MNLPPLPDPHTILLVAPFYNRSGYGMGGRAMAVAWHQAGLRVRLLPVDEPEPGVDDFDLALLKSLEQTPILGTLAVVFFHVPSQAWLDLQLPPGSLRIMCTTFDSSLQGNPPPPEWIRVCNQMDQVWLMSEREVPVWCKAGLDPARVRSQMVPHPWIQNPGLPPITFTPRPGPFRFMTLAMFQPRRRWDVLLEAYFEEFRDEPDVELYMKVNYPSWHPVPGQPQRDLVALIEGARTRTGSKARVILDDDLGTRMGICRLMDACDVYVSTDTSTTAPIFEALVRGKRLILPEGYGRDTQKDARILIAEDPSLVRPMTEEMFAYQPHHRGKTMPMLQVADVRRALRQAFELPEAKTRNPWEGWEAWVASIFPPVEQRAFYQALSEGFGAKAAASRIPVRWEGSPFVYHSLSHVNRQLCRRLLASGTVDLSLVPYEPDQFDPAAQPELRPLAACVQRPLPRTAVHVRHQWPPCFEPPAEGAWVMIQPWEFGGMPAEWVAPIRDQVDEVWVPSTWVKDCYVASGIPEAKVAVIPNGVDPEVFSPEGPALPLRTSKTFRFLFLGGTIFRKGIDVLLKAYQRAFRASDDVCLVIKGQPGVTYQGTELDQMLENLRRQDPESPEIEYRVDALDEVQVASLYRACQAFVLPYRGEGFGLPIAEAMASGLPVIVTERGAARDFVTADWAYLLPSQPRPIPAVDAYHPSQAGFWLEEPDEEALVQAMRRAFEAPEEAREKGRRGRAHAVAHLGWEEPVARIQKRLADLAQRTPCRATPLPPPEEPRREAFLLEPDWAGSAWVEVLLSFLIAFQPGEPVALILPMDPHREGGQLSLEEAQDRVIAIVQQAGKESFPDVILVDKPEDLLETLRGFDRLRWVDPTRGSVVGLDGPIGTRLAQARQSLVQP